MDVLSNLLEQHLRQVEGEKTDRSGYCYRLYNTSKYRLSLNTASVVDQLDKDNTGDGDVGAGGEAASESSTTRGSVEEIDEWERARAQTKLLHDKQTKATNYQLHNVPHSSRTYCLVSDYS
jgi:hypothetical protein